MRTEVLYQHPNKYTRPDSPGEHKQEPDPRPGCYYVSCANGHQYRILAGPFPTHQEALDQVRRVRDLANEIDPRSHWYGFGTCRIDEGSPRKGILNDRLGL